MTRLGLVMDTQTCIGCLACTVACKVRHASPPGVWLAPVVQQETGEYPNVHRAYLPLMCMHCDDAPCVAACPSKAIAQRPDGIVVIDAKRCCGSGACVIACPHGAIHPPVRQSRRYYYGKPTPYEEAVSGPEPGTAQKCDFCAPRIDAGALPACVEACPTESRIFGDVDLRTSTISERLRAEATATLPPLNGDRPAVRFTLRGLSGQSASALSSGVLRDAPQGLWDRHHAVEFTLLSMGAGVAIVALLSGFASSEVSRVIAPLAVILVALGGLALVSDLGRPERFVQAVRNLPASWISRGAVANVAFMLLSVLLMWGDAASETGVLVGYGALAAVVIAYPGLALRSYRSSAPWSTWLVPAWIVNDGLSSAAAILAVVAATSQHTLDSFGASLWLLGGAIARGVFSTAYVRRVPGHEPASARLPYRLGTLTIGVGGVLAAIGAQKALTGSAELVFAILAAACSVIATYSGRLVILRTGTRRVPMIEGSATTKTSEAPVGDELSWPHVGSRS